jgi:sugar phosphate isomerase/epimerase
MNLSISNIAWSNEDDEQMYTFLREKEFIGVEIAPTRIFKEAPYNQLMKAKDFAIKLKQNYELTISSMQSIWYGRNEKVFGSEEERRALLEYTKRAIDFASIIGSKNLVFGCPKNRVSQNKNDMDIAISFFRELGEYAKHKNTVLSIEPNPVIYNTNFINYTSQAIEIVKSVKSDGFKVNLDLGTIIYNGEDLKAIVDDISLINHIHISEPNLALIEKRELHNQLYGILKQANYQGFVSIEMGKRDNLDEVKETIKYVREVFE